MAYSLWFRHFGECPADRASGSDHRTQSNQASLAEISEKSFARHMFKNLKEGQESSVKRQGDLRRLGPHRSKHIRFPPDDEAHDGATGYQSDVRERLNRLMVFSGNERRLALKVRPE